MEDKETKYARWLNNTLSPEERRAMEATGELEELEAIRSALANMKAPAYDREQAFRRLQAARSEKKHTPLLRQLRPWLAVAAGILLLISLGYAWYLSGATVLRSDPGTTLVHTFPDGSQVELNDGSSLCFRPGRWSQVRWVRLKGEAFFSVEPGAAFRVETPQGDVEVLGTEFNVRSRAPALAVACYSGRVRVVSGRASRELQPGQGIQVRAGQWQTVELTGDMPAWQQGISRFRDTPIAEVFGEMERQFRVEINLREEVEHTLRFTGAFGHEDLEVALRGVCLPLGLDFRIEGSAVEILQN